MRRLVHGNYDQKHARAIHLAAPHLEFSEIEKMVAIIEPQFLVIVPEEPASWRAPLFNLGVKLSSIQVLSNRNGKRIITHSGYTPARIDSRIVSQVSKAKGFFPRALEVKTPSTIIGSGSVEILVNGSKTIWRVVSAQKVVYLFPNGTFDLNDRENLQLVRDIEGNLHLEEII